MLHPFRVRGFGGDGIYIPGWNPGLKCRTPLGSGKKNPNGVQRLSPGRIPGFQERIPEMKRTPTGFNVSTHGETLGQIEYPAPENEPQRGSTSKSKVWMLHPFRVRGFGGDGIYIPGWNPGLKCRTPLGSGKKNPNGVQRLSPGRIPGFQERIPEMKRTPTGFNI